MSRIAITGSDVPLASNSLTSVALLLPELTTNAAKYGALSSPSGRLLIDIQAIGERLHIVWEEHGSPRAAEPVQREGFGTTLERAALKGMGGTIARDWRSSGLALALTIPLASLID
jgi:two-component sensor histidine kinase